MDSTLEYILPDVRGFLLLSLRAWHLRPPLLEAQSGRCLSAVGSPRTCLTGGAGSLPRVVERDRRGS
jgi:hypothetical protein